MLPATSSAQLALPFQWIYNPISQIQSIAYSPDGTRLAVAGFTGVQVYSTSSGALIGSIPTSATNGVFSVAFSKDSKLLAVGGQGIVDTKYAGIAEIWNVASISLNASFASSSTNVYSVAFSPDGSTLADGGDNGALELWSIASGSKSFALSTAAKIQVNSVSFSPDGKTLAAGGQNSGNGTNTAVLELWNVSAGVLNFRPSIQASFISSVAFSPNGSSVVVGGASIDPSTHSDVGLLQLYSVSTGQLSRSLATLATNISSVTFSPDGSKVADGGISDVSGVLETWNASAASIPVPYETSETGGVLSVAYAPNGKKLTAGGTSAQSTLSVLENWGTSTTTPASIVNVAPYQGLSAISFAGAGQTIVTAGSGLDENGNQIGALNLWNATSGVPFAKLNTSATPPITAAVSSDGVTLADGGTGYSSVGNQTGILELWNISSQKLIATLPSTSQSINSVAFSPSGKLLADGGISVNPTTSAQSGSVEVWTLATQKVVEFTTAATTIYTVAFSPDSNTLADGGIFSGPVQYGVVELFDVATGEVKSSLPTSIVQVSTEVFSPDGATLLVAGYTSDGPGVELWNVSTQKLITTLDLSALTSQVNSLAFNNDGKTLFVATETGLAVFDTTSAQLLGFYNGGIFSNSGVQCLAVSSNSSELAYVTTLGTLATSINPYVVSTAKIDKLSLNVNTILGGNIVMGSVTLAAKAGTGGVTVPLSSSSSSVSAPSSVTVPAGATTAAFTLKTEGVNSSITVTIKAGDGTLSKSAVLTVKPSALVAESLTPSTVGGGVNVTGTVTLSGPAAPGGTSVALTSNSVSASVPSQVIVPYGSDTASFTVFTSTVSAQTVAKITASLGAKSDTVSLAISPSRLGIISISPSSVVGGTATTGTVSLTGNAPEEGFVVALSSSSPSVRVPNSVTVESGSDTATFSITTLAVPTDINSTVSAKSGSTTKTTTVAVKAPVVSSLTLSPSSVTGGASSTGTVTIASVAPSGGLVISLSSSLAAATVPATVRIPAGSTSKTFTIKTKAVSARKTVTIRAKSGSSSETASLIVS